MAGIDALCGGKGQWAIGVELGRDVFFFDVHLEDLVDEEGFFAIQETFKESFHFGGVMRSRNDSAQSLLRAQKGALEQVVSCVLGFVLSMGGVPGLRAFSASCIRWTPTFCPGEEKQSDPGYFVNMGTEWGRAGRWAL